MDKKIIEISQETYKMIKRIGRMGENDDDVVNRGFTYLDSDSNFWNQE